MFGCPCTIGKLGTMGKLGTIGKLDKIAKQHRLPIHRVTIRYHTLSYSYYRIHTQL